MKPAFRTTYWQNYPQPFYPGSSGQYPVPGWGVRPVMAGPARLGVGQDDAPSIDPNANWDDVGNRIVTLTAVSIGLTLLIGAGAGYLLWRYG